MRAERGQSKRGMSRLAAAIGWAWLLSGCVQGPDYVKPTVDVPGQYRFAGAPIPPDEAVAGQAWWVGFGDPTLDSLVQEAIANNRDLRIASARVEEFDAILAGTR